MPPIVNLNYNSALLCCQALRIQHLMLHTRSITLGKVVLNKHKMLYSKRKVVDYCDQSRSRSEDHAENRENVSIRC